MSTDTPLDKDPSQTSLKSSNNLAAKDNIDQDNEANLLPP
jgi:hypothetical protein